jgi:hypothetical protein
MEIVQRIMSKLVGEEISLEELDEVSGALKNSCEDGHPTWNGDYGNGGIASCDFD